MLLSSNPEVATRKPVKRAKPSRTTVDTGSTYDVANLVKTWQEKARQPVGPSGSLAGLLTGMRAGTSVSPVSPMPAPATTLQSVLDTMTSPDYTHDQAQEPNPRQGRAVVSAQKALEEALAARKDYSPDAAVQAVLDDPDALKQFAQTGVLPEKYQPPGKGPGRSDLVRNARIDLANAERSRRMHGIGADVQGPVAANKLSRSPAVGDVTKMTWEEYQALPEKQRAAVDFNTMLVQAVRKDKGNQKLYEEHTTDQQEKTYNAAVERIFGEDRGSDLYAPETVAVLKKIKFRDTEADLDDFLNLNAAITTEDLSHLKTMAGPTAFEAKASPAQLDAAQLAENLAGSTQEMEAALVKGNQVLKNVTTLAREDRGALLSQLGAAPTIATSNGPGYGVSDRDKFFQMTLEALVNPANAKARDKILADAQTEMQPGDMQRFMNYANQRSLDALNFNIPLTQQRYEGAYTPDQWRDFMGLGGGQGNAYE
jgi:hypothetical protein